MRIRLFHRLVDTDIEPIGSNGGTKHLQCYERHQYVMLLRLPCRDFLIGDNGFQNIRDMPFQKRELIFHLIRRAIESVPVTLVSKAHMLDAAGIVEIVEMNAFWGAFESR